jgi:drug/metabolite transporter (DMT)-like permease
MIASMVIFGTIGIFVEYIAMPSGVSAAFRGIVGMLVLLITMAAGKRKPDKSVIKKRLPVIIASGTAIGFNWILLFEAYRHTGVPVATVCYYMAPIIVIAFSPVFFKEKLGVKKIVCVAVALLGAVAVSGVLQADTSKLTGILLGLGAAVLYASVVIMNKFLADVPSLERTAFQLGVAGFTVLPYALLTRGELSVRPLSLGLLFVVGVFHTGFAYNMYFGAVSRLKGQTVAILSYIDPASAIFLSALFLSQTPTALEALGAVLIIGAAFVGEVSFKKKAKDE